MWISSNLRRVLIGLQHASSSQHSATVGLSASRLRFLVPLCTILLIRFVCLALLYVAYRAGVLQGQGLIESQMSYDWLHLFSAWDTGHYCGIAQSWYPSSVSPVWAFFPLYPAAIMLLGWFRIDPWVSAFMISTTFGLLSIVLFQKVAETYLPRTRALVATVLYFLLPAVFIFSAVSYTEPMFLLFSLLAWYFHLRRDDARAVMAAALCSLTRSYGILIVIPLMYDYLREKQFRNLLLTAVPLFALSGWLLYAFFRTDDLLAPLSAQAYWRTETVLTVTRALAQLATGSPEAIPTLLPLLRLAFVAVIFAAFTIFLSIKAWKIDRALGLYMFASIALITYFGFAQAYLSFPRFLMLLFPIGLPLYVERRWLLLVAIVLLSVLDFVAWWAFLTNVFFFH